MADKKSTALTNETATPRKANNSIIERGTVQVSSGKAVVLAADADAQVYRLCRLPVNCRIISVKIAHPAITAGTDYDLGAYLINGGAVVDKDSLVDGISMATARGVPTEILFSNITGDVEKKLWELQSGVTTDPKGEYEIALTANTVGSADGTIQVDVLWTY